MWKVLPVVLSSLFVTAYSAHRLVVHHHVPAKTDVLGQVLRKVAVDNTIILGEASCGYLQFADNWIMHALELNVSNFLAIASDHASFDYLHKAYPDHVIPASLLEPSADMSGTQILEYGTKEFNSMMCRRIPYQQAVITRGFKLLWCDMDTVWLQNVIEVLPQGLDWVGACDDTALGNAQETENVCGCLMFWSPTQKAQDAIESWQTTCMQLNGEGDDQRAFNILWADGSLKQSLQWYILPQQVFPSGGLALPMNRSAERKLGPALIHANFRVGFEAKRKFLLERQAWKVAADKQYPRCLKS